MIRLRPEEPAGARCDAAGCSLEYEVRLAAGSDEHRAAKRDVKFCDQHLSRYWKELEELRARRCPAG